MVLQVWYFMSGAAGVFLFPYLNVYLSQRGLTSAQIGLLSALRPWISAPLSMGSTAIADKFKVHTPLLVVCFALTTIIRASIPLGSGVAMLIVMLMAAEVFGAPVGVIGDAAVLSNCHDVSTLCDSGDMQ